MTGPVQRMFRLFSPRRALLAFGGARLLDILCPATYNRASRDSPSPARRPGDVMPTPDDAANLPDSAAPEMTLLAWRIFRATTRPGGIPLVLLAYAAAFAMWRLLFPHPVALLLPLVALTGGLREYLFPVSFRLTTRGAYVVNGPARLFLAWEDVRRATHGDDGVFLSPLARPSRLDSFRGVTLCFADGNDDAVLSTVRSMWRPPEGVAP